MSKNTQDINIEKLHQEFMNENHYRLEFSEFGSTAKETKKAIEFTIEHLSKQSEFRTCTIAEFKVKDKIQLGFAYCDDQEIPPDLGHKHIKFIELEALAAKNAQIAELEDKIRNLEVNVIMNLDNENKMLKQSETCGYCDFGNKHQQVVYQLQSQLTAKTEAVEELVKGIRKILPELKNPITDNVREHLKELLTKHAKGK